jgi:hypothetical protein
MNFRTEKEIGIENENGIEKNNEKSSQLRTKNVAFLSLRRREKIYFRPEVHFLTSNFIEIVRLLFQFQSGCDYTLDSAITKCILA